MIVRDTAVPLAMYPYSSTSRVVHWLTRRHGKVSTLLKGALRPRSPFLGEYELLGTSELLYFARCAEGLHTGKECAMLHRREGFRSNWRAGLTASYLATLFNRTVPAEADPSGQFELLEELLDYTEESGGSLLFLLWAELRFCDFNGHRPRLDRCLGCTAEKAVRFSAGGGGIICKECARKQSLPTMPCPPDVLAILRSIQRSAQPYALSKTRLSPEQRTVLNGIVSRFLSHHFNLFPEPRNAVCTSGLH